MKRGLVPPKCDWQQGSKGTIQIQQTVYILCKKKDDLKK
jgi:hypothetical protein